MSYLLKRTAQAVFTVFSVITLSFVIVRLLPGGPADFLRAQLIQQSGGSLTQEQINQRIASQTNLAVDEPLYVQYVDYMAAILRGDFGTSTWHNEPAAAVLGPAIPWTVFLMATSLFIAFVLGVVLGAFMAYREGSGFDVGSTAVSLLTNSVPSYVIALLLLTFAGYRFGWFPTGGQYASGLEPGLSPEFLLSAMHHGALPIVSLVVASFGGWALNMRGNSIRVLGEDYLRVARLRGLPERRIALRYVGRNAILPMYTGLLIAIGFMFGGSIILEEIFAYPGVGYYMIQAIGQRDYPVMMGAFILIAIAVTIGVFVADVTYGVIDPRAEGGEARESY
ncbi:ABC transporter permease [Halegenticoccus tardaugens]|uniref:ABC transporter permease n=1 Tax=Halegenticoccus tardaugens TaxID=2071624 RepID=UPI00100A9E2B|nr:ABC transporter permease [Halegenticoccus tardaugens]